MNKKLISLFFMQICITAVNFNFEWNRENAFLPQYDSQLPNYLRNPITVEQEEVELEIKHSKDDISLKWKVFIELQKEFVDFANSFVQFNELKEKFEQMAIKNQLPKYQIEEYLEKKKDFTLIEGNLKQEEKELIVQLCEKMQELLKNTHPLMSSIRTFIRNKSESLGVIQDPYDLKITIQNLINKEKKIQEEYLNQITLYDVIRYFINSEKNNETSSFFVLSLGIERILKAYGERWKEIVGNKLFNLSAKGSDKSKSSTFWASVRFDLNFKLADLKEIMDFLYQKELDGNAPFFIRAEIEGLNETNWKNMIKDRIPIIYRKSLDKALEDDKLKITIENSRIEISNFKVQSENLFI